MVNKIRAVKEKIDDGLYSAAEGAACRMKLDGRTACLLAELFYKPYGMELDSVNIKGYRNELDNVLKSGFAEIKEEKAALSNRGKIAAKAIAEAQNKFLTEVLNRLTKEEKLILDKLI